LNSDSMVRYVLHLYCYGHNGDGFSAYTLDRHSALTVLAMQSYDDVYPCSHRPAAQLSSADC